MKKDYLKLVLKADSVAVLAKNVAEFMEALKEMDEPSAEELIKRLKESLSESLEILKNSSKKSYIVASGNSACIVLLARFVLLYGNDTREAMIRYLNIFQLQIKLYIDVTEEPLSKAENRKKVNELKRILADLEEWCGYTRKVHPDEKILVLKFGEYGNGINGLCSVADVIPGFGRTIMLFEEKNKYDSDHNPVFTLFHEIGHDIMFCLSEDVREHMSIMEEVSGINFCSEDDEETEGHESAEDCADIIAIGLLYGSRYEEYIREGYKKTLDYDYMNYLSDVTFNLLDMCELKTEEIAL